MSNLGLYQLMVVAAKRVGGPHKLFGLVSLGSSLTTAGVILGISKIKKAIDEKEREKESKIVYTVNQDGITNDGLQFKTGEKFKVMVKVKDIGVLIEKVGEQGNPYVVSFEFIRAISDYAGT